MNNAVNILREGSMMKALTKLGIPIVIAMLIMAIYNVVDTFWVARLGTLPVAAVSVVFPLSLLFLGIGLMFGVGGGVYVSRLLGAKQIVKASQVASVSVVTSVILAALIAFMCNAFLPDILLFMGANEGMMHLAEAYGRLFIISCVIGTLNVSMSNIIVSQGASKTSAMAMIIGSIVNVALDPLFIYTFNWGVE
ncbi:MATE family efflux transporter, partial [Segatella oris]|uniref:MATE family efflux transporter n=1 Tax=Segatella oris TaxID=28135 RepID=UPI00360D6C36